MEYPAPMIFLAISIDTEIDRAPDWKISADGTFISVIKGIPLKLTPLFNQFGAKPTYLLSSEVIENQDCVDTLKTIGNCELGTHLHGDLIEPQRKVLELTNVSTAAMQNSYPKDIERQKLRSLTDLFIKKFSYLPQSFRAGRFAAGNNTIVALDELGYLVDSSITPGIDWNYPEGRANFLSAREQPYFPSKENMLEEGSSKILEVPVSIVTPRIARYLRIHNKNKVLVPFNIVVNNRLFQSHWLRPSFESSANMLGVITKIITKYSASDNVVLNMMFHSMEVIPNASPYTRTETQCRELLEKVKTVLEFSSGNGFQFVTLSELYPVFAAKK